MGATALCREGFSSLARIAPAFRRFPHETSALRRGRSLRDRGHAAHVRANRTAAESAASDDAATCDTRNACDPRLADHTKYAARRAAGDAADDQPIDRAEFIERA
jgi:hypothetical protein